MKKFVSILVGLIISPMLVFAAATDVTLTGNGETEVLIGSYTLKVTGATRVMDSITVDSASFDVTLSTSKSFGVSSADRRKFTVSGDTAITKEFNCTSSESAVTVFAAQDSGTVTVTITPSTSETCSGLGGGGGGGGGGSSSGGSRGGGGSAAPAPALSVATPTAPSVAKPSPVAQAVSPIFNKDLARGARNDDVKRVQQLLATDPEVYPEGLATGLYGALTEKAVRKFQLKHGVIKSTNEQGNGRLGPKTRAKLAEVYGSGAVAPAAPASVPVPASAPVTPAPAAPAPTATPASDNSALQSQIQNLLKQIEALQQQLKAQPAATPAPTTPNKFQSPVPYYIGAFNSN